MLLRGFYWPLHYPVEGTFSGLAWLVATKEKWTYGHPAFESHFSASMTLTLLSLYQTGSEPFNLELFLKASLFHVGILVCIKVMHF